MFSTSRLSLGAALLLGTAVLAPTLPAGIAHAQTTSSSVSGVVRDAGGNPVPGASVTMIHVPTGTASSATTSANGSFFETGLQVGGPYSITISSTAGAIVEEGIRLRPSSNSLQFVIENVADEIIVTGTRAAGQDIGDGVGSVYSDADILNQPSVNRDLIATLVRDPLANSAGEGILSVAGSNPRFNALSIDGSLQQDDFGLSDSTYPTGRAPVSLDVIESASVAATDYSVTTSGFTGGLVNVVTKSGTNELDGALYYYGNNEDFIGDRSFDSDFEVAPFNEDEYGFVLRGPIVEDKLFFLVSYDEFESGSGREFTEDDLDDGVNAQLFPELASIVQDTYGFDIGTRPLSVATPESSERFLAKLDWNVNNDHRASFTYQDTQESGFSNVGNLNFSSVYYATPQDLKAYTGQLFSDWSDSFSTELRVNFKDNDRAQLCQGGADVGEFEFRLSEEDLQGTALEGLIDDGDDVVDDRDITIRGGCDVFRQGNTFADERLQVQAVGRYNRGDHLLTFGGEYQNYQLDNLFGQFSSGRYTFNSLDDIQDQTANVLVALPQSGLREDVRAAWGYDQLAAFVQDSWQATPELRLDFGVRYERIFQDDTPVARDFFLEDYLFNNSVNLDGNDLLMPRASFEYQPFARTRIAGGVGLYGGGDPKVWTSNAFTPASFFEFGFRVDDVNPAQGVPQRVLDQVAENDANDPSFLDFISPDFDTPSDWKASLRIDQEFDMDFGGVNLGSDYLFSAQALYTKTNKGFRWFNQAQVANPEATIGTAPDGRPIYADLDDAGIANAVALTNTDEGESWVLTASLAKDWANGLGAYASYAYQDIDTVAPGTSSRGVSNLEGTVDFDVNNPQLGRSNFETEHAFKLGLSYETDILAGLQSQFSLFGQITSGNPFSYTFDTDRNEALFGRQGGERTPFDADLLYVPNIENGMIADDLVVVGENFDTAAFVDLVQSRGLETGGILDRNSDSSNWNQRFDFQFQQEVPFFNEAASRYVGENRLKFVLDIFNVANLLDSDWGTQFNGVGNGQANIVGANLVTRADVAANGVDGASALLGDAPRTACVNAGDCVYRFDEFQDRNSDSSVPSRFRSLYEIRVGLRYEF